MYECLKGSQVRLTHGLVSTRRARPLLRRWRPVNYTNSIIFSLWMVKRRVMSG
jgi:hypothetical protein